MKYSQRIILLVVLSRERRIKFCQRKKKREAVTKLRKKAFKKLRETKKWARQRRKGCWKERGRKEAKKRWDNEEEKKKRSKSCGHGCTKRDSGCTSTCPFLESSAALWFMETKERMERDTRSSQLPWRWVSNIGGRRRDSFWRIWENIWEMKDDFFFFFSSKNRR